MNGESDHPPAATMKLPRSKRTPFTRAEAGERARRVLLSWLEGAKRTGEDVWVTLGTLADAAFPEIVSTVDRHSAHHSTCLAQLEAFVARGWARRANPGVKSGRAWWVGPKRQPKPPVAEKLRITAAPIQLEAPSTARPRLPNQRTVLAGEMLRAAAFRALVADDPGAGFPLSDIEKTIIRLNQWPEEFLQDRSWQPALSFAWQAFERAGYMKSGGDVLWFWTARGLWEALQMVGGQLVMSVVCDRLAHEAGVRDTFRKRGEQLRAQFDRG